MSYLETHWFDHKRGYGIWQVIVSYLSRFHQPKPCVLDLGSGFGTFVNNVDSSARFALDIDGRLSSYLQKGIVFKEGSCETIPFESNKFDLVFSSNLFEHLTEEQLTKTIDEIKRVLKKGGRLILILPNFKYAFKEYFDDYTHKSIHTDVGLTNRLIESGFRPVQTEAKFLPFSFKSRLPKWKFLTWLYLRSPVKPFAKQMLVVVEHD